MKAVMFSGSGAPLVFGETEVPAAREGELVVRVEACAVCRTDLHIVDGELRKPKLPLIPGHQIVGRVVGGDLDGVRVGVAWLAWTCGECSLCRSGRENLCERALLTGYTRDGGFAEFAVADRRFCFVIPQGYEPDEAAPLLCAGMIGFRAYRMAGDARNLGLYGFGSAAQILAQLAVSDGRRVFAFTREGDTAAQELARSKGAVWSGASTDAPPVALDAAIIFAADGSLVVSALRQVVAGGTVVCAGIHMSDIPSFPYELLWGERSIRSVANLTRRDGEEFFARIRTLRIETKRSIYSLDRAGEALDDLRTGRLTGTAVLVP